MRRRPAPSDDAAHRAWLKIMRCAREHCLVVDASGGVATLALPEEQRKAGLRERVLRMHVAMEAEEAATR